MSWRERFNMSGPPLPRGASGETFFDGDPHFQRLARVFAWLAAEPGIGVVTGEPGVGKTSAIRHLCRTLPQHEHHIVYLSGTVDSHRAESGRLPPPSRCPAALSSGPGCVTPRSFGGLATTPYWSARGLGEDVGGVVTATETVAATSLRETAGLRRRPVRAEVTR